MCLAGSAKTYWSPDFENVEGRRRRWVDMQEKLRKKYLPALHRRGLHDRWHEIRQDGRPVCEYIHELEEHQIRYKPLGKIDIETVLSSSELVLILKFDMRQNPLPFLS